MDAASDATGGRARGLVAREPAPLADGEASRSYSLYHSRISATKAAAVDLHRRRKARIDEALALGARRRSCDDGDAARGATARRAGPAASEDAVVAAEMSARPRAASSSAADVPAAVADGPGPGFAVDTDSETRGFRRAQLRWALRPGAGRPQLVGGALDGLELPTPDRWAGLAERLAGVAPADGGAPMIALDTETTGVGQSSGTIAFLIGAAYFDGDALVVEQWTLLRLSAEAAMLRDLAARLDALAGPATTLVTFNGASFDLPLLRTRLRRYGVTAAVLAATHVDLLLPARRLWREQESNCRLGTLERSRLGVSRQGDVAGSEIPQAYWRWLEAPDEPRRSALIERVHVHNVVDLLTLPALAVVIAAAIESPSTLAEALRVARLEVARGDDRRALAALEGWLPEIDASVRPDASAHAEVAAAAVPRDPRVSVDAGAVPCAQRPTATTRAAWSGEVATLRERAGVGGARRDATDEVAGSRARGTPRHALGGIRERMARLGVGAPSGSREVARIRAASRGSHGPSAALGDRDVGVASEPSGSTIAARGLSPAGRLPRESRAPSRVRVGPDRSAERAGLTGTSARALRPQRTTAAPQTAGLAASAAAENAVCRTERSAAREHASRPPQVARARGFAAPGGAPPLRSLERQAWGLAAGLLRRLGEDARSAALWAQICRRSPGDPEAHEALAKLLEHRLGDLPRALAVTRASSAPCPRRLARLRRKLAKHSRREPESVYG